MSWRYRTPSRDDYPTEEEFQAALAAYEYAEGAYIDECVERAMEEKYN